MISWQFKKNIEKEWLKEHSAHFFYEYDEYMSDFKRFQRIPLFEFSNGKTTEEKSETLKMA